ncbi:MAG: response regulator [Desulfobacterales bacterium]|nr:response regulator [Desulfobacterales bacterium]
METLPRQKLLIVEDVPINVKLLSQIFSQEHNIIVATNGEDAISLTEIHVPDLILLDIILPTMDGFSVCQKLKSHPKTKKIPIIFITVKNQLEDEYKGLELGAVDYIHKPFHPNIVRARVNAHLKLKLYSQQLESLIEEKEFLLKEIHHRVKNNLQIISSLLDMMANRSDDLVCKNSLQAARVKIINLALIHTQLYNSDRFDQIDMKKHLNELIGSVSKLYAQAQTAQITIDIDSSIYLPVTVAIPLTIALNELISNAFKYAVQYSKNPCIDMRMFHQYNGDIIVVIRDNGPGLPDHLDIDQIHSLGLKLVRNIICSQLRGSISFENNNGTLVTIHLTNNHERGEEHV